MTAPLPDPIETDRFAFDRLLRRSHRTVLLAIAACAAIAALQPHTETSAPPDPAETTVAVALALGVVVARRAATSPVVSQRTRLVLTLCAYALAAALAVFGTFVAMTTGERQTGLVFALAAAIFCFRPPQPMGTSPLGGDRSPRRP